MRNKYWRANVIKKDTDEEVKGADRDKLLAQMANSSRPFVYIGEFNPALATPWRQEEKDWWATHERLVEEVRKSDASPPLQFDINAKSRLPQLVFYGDSITEGWRGTSFGSIPSKGRMWKKDENIAIRKLFDETFGDDSPIWGKERALKSPLVLGISGSRTYDFLWRIENGEFPTSKLLDRDHKDDEEENKESEGGNGDEESNNIVFQLEKLERIYIVLMGTNNIGGGMLPNLAVKGMDAVGRTILKLHKTNFPNTPAAMLFSELLPRKDDFRAVKMCPPRCKNETTKEPYKSFIPAIEKVNKALPDVVEGWRKDYPNSRIVLLSGSPVMGTPVKDGENEGANDNEYEKTISCGKEMFAIDDQDEFDTYMPDRLHPNSKGYELWSRCLYRGLEVVMDHAISLKEGKEETTEVEDVT